MKNDVLLFLSLARMNSFSKWMRLRFLVFYFSLNRGSSLGTKSGRTKLLSSYIDRIMSFLSGTGRKSETILAISAIELSLDF